MVYYQGVYHRVYRGENHGVYQGVYQMGGGDINLCLTMLRLGLDESPALKSVQTLCQTYHGLLWFCFNLIKLGWNPLANWQLGVRTHGMNLGKKRSNQLIYWSRQPPFTNKGTEKNHLKKKLRYQNYSTQRALGCSDFPLSTLLTFWPMLTALPEPQSNHFVDLICLNFVMF